MTKPLIIVESPAKCKKIESYLDYKYKCIASFGHIRELKDGLKCIDIDNNFKPKFSLCTKNKNISNLRDAVKNSSDVYLATDDDREGEAIAWHICQVCKLSVKTTKRILFHEITKPAIQRAIQNTTIINMNKVNSQLSRVVLDRLVGFMVSPILWKNINRQSGLSAGRCQTPALKLVYDNQKEIDESPGQIVYNTIGYFTQKNITFQLDKNFEKKQVMEKFLEETVNFDHILEKKTVRQSTRNAPEPLTTSTLQQLASNQFHYSPKATMKYAQTLYENGLITYMRTDSKTYSKEFIETAKIYIRENHDESYIHKNINNLSTRKSDNPNKCKKNDKKNENVQEAHEAIRPTNIKKVSCEEMEKLTNYEKRLYVMIWKHSVQSCMSDAIVNVLDIIITAPKDTIYKNSEEQIVFPGWKILDRKEKVSYFEYLSNVKSGIVPYKKVKSIQTLKSKVNHFTEARLVQLLEKKGIGRPSTFSSLIHKIQERNYVKRENVEGIKIKCVDFTLVDDTIEEHDTDKIVGQEKNKLVIQQLGVIVLEFLMKYYDSLFNYEYTSAMEKELDIILEGNKIWHKPCEDCYKIINEINSNLNPPDIKNNKSKNKIDDKHSYVIGKYGPCIIYQEDGKTTFKKIKKNVKVDLEKLANGDYKVEDLLENEEDSLGKYKEQSIIVKKGKYGFFANYNGKNYSLKSLNGDHTMENIINIIEGNVKTNIGIIREFNNNLSLRKGQYGPYVYYKTNSMKKTKFLSLKGCKLDVELASDEEFMEYLKEKYDVE